jgi:hypothetical protein
VLRPRDPHVPPVGLILRQLRARDRRVAARLPRFRGAPA